MGQPTFNTIEEALEDIRRGKMVIVVDDENRENEGDLVAAAEKITPEIVNFMTKYGRGLVCLPLTAERCEELGLPPMVERPGDSMETAFTISVDAKDEHITTGISAFERAHTIKVCIDPATRPEDLAKPGHVFPLRAMDGGVLRRPGHTEAAVDLARMAGLYPAGVICEIMNDDGTMARVPELFEFAQKHGLKMITIADLIKYRMQMEKLVERIAKVKLPSRWGEFDLYAYREVGGDKTHVALVMGEFELDEAVLVRVHSECLTGDVLGSERCDCGEQLQRALEMIAEEGKGVLVYMRQEGRGIGLANKMLAYQLQDQGMDTVEANLALGFPPDMRDYGRGSQILYDLGVRKLRLMTNNPKKYAALSGYGLEIVERVPIQVTPNPNNERYLATKKTKLGHLF